MFTGIVRGLCLVTHVVKKPDFVTYAVELGSQLTHGVEIGASISIDGTCQTVVRCENGVVWFDAIGETLKRTTLDALTVGRRVNVERAAKFGDEIGGHLLSGHIYGTAEILEIQRSADNCRMVFRCPASWMKYFFSKGFIAIDGASLTLVDVDTTGTLSVHLIPETLKLTTLGIKTVGERVNIELDSQTQTIVETIERVMKQRESGL